MSHPLDDAQIQSIVQRVLRETSSGQPPAPSPAAGPAAHLSHVGRAGRTSQGPSAAGQDGIFLTMDDAVAAARAAFRALGQMTLAKRHEIIAAIRASMRANAELLARMACEETGLGRPEDKLQKNLLVVEKTPGPEIAHV